jgi:hypothetical protein
MNMELAEDGPTFERFRQYWRDLFSVPQFYTSTQKFSVAWRGRKGMVEMTVGTSAVCPRVSHDHVPNVCGFKII